MALERGYDYVNAVNDASLICRIEPVPKRRAKRKPVVKVLRLDEHVLIEEVRHDRLTLLGISSKTLCSLIPSILKASLYSVSPARVLATSARRKRLPRRDPSVA